MADNKSDAVDALTDGILGLASDLMGKKIPKPRISGKKRKEMSDYLSNFWLSLDSLSKIGQNPPKNDQEWMNTIDFVDSEMHKIGDIPPEVHYAKYTRDNYSSLLRLPVELTPYLRKTNYLEYCNEIRSIASRILDQGLGSKVDVFFNEMAANLHVASLPPLFYVKARRSFQYISKPHRRPRQLQLERIIGIYLEMSGAYEQSVPSLIGLFQIVENKQPNAAQISRMSLRSKSDFILSRRPNLASDLNITIRNSIAHPSSYMIHFNQDTIEFQDRHNKATVTFPDFVKLCRKLSALSAAVSMTYMIFMLERWSRTWNKYCSIKKTMKAWNRAH
jgi:hypothetical protein